MQNGLCKNRGQDENEFVRGPCAIAPYDAEKCASVCIYGELHNCLAFHEWSNNMSHSRGKQVSAS